MLWPRHSAKQTQFAECYHQDTRRKAIFKKNQILFEKYLPSVWQFNTRHMFIICRVQHSATRNSKNQKYLKKNSCRVPCRLTLGELTVNGGSGVTTVYFRREPNCTRQNVCRVPDKWHSTKLALPELFMASAIRRVLHSANNLPSVFCILPMFRALGKLKESGSV